MKFKMIFSVVALFLQLTSVYSQQPTLQPWVQVYGTVNGQELGRNVTGIVPTANFPFRAAVSRSSSTGIYTLQTQNDTSVKRIFLGENLLSGDFNDDGWKDVVVSKYINGYDTVYVYWGTPTGIDSMNPIVIAGEARYDNFQARCIGDINNDGFPDLIASAPGYPNGFARGKVYIYLNPLIKSTPDTVLVGDLSGVGLGINCSVGDLNDDGINDLVVRGRKGDQFEYVNIYYGSEIGKVNLTFFKQLRSHYITGGAGLACFDINGDGIVDLLWTTVDTIGGYTYVNTHFGGSNFDTIPSLKLQNPGVANFGNVVVNAGDMNGDGYK